MGFFIRHLLLLLLVVVAPVGGALYWDAYTEIERAKAAGERSVRRSADALSSQAELMVRARLDTAVAAAHDFEDQQFFRELARGRQRAEPAAQFAVERLTAIRPDGGFAWLVGADGKVVAGDEAGPAQAEARDLSGHPLFEQSQLGYAGDMLWRKGDPLVWAAASPLVEDQSAAGAVIIGWPIDQTYVAGLARRLDVGLTLMDGQDFVATSLEGSAVREVVGPALVNSGAVIAGAMPEPMVTPVPGLPLFLGPKAEGLAYASQAVSVPGGDLSWVVSVPTTAALEAVAGRQVNLLALGVVLAMVVLLFTLAAHRIHVRPLNVIADHLSEIQLGRGELELSELKVSGPFRRIVRLINMTVQKLPTRGLTGLTGSLPAVRPPPSASTSGSSRGSVVGDAVQSTLPSGDSSLRLDLDRRVPGETSNGLADSSDAIAGAIAALDGASGPTTTADDPSRSLSDDLERDAAPARKSASQIRGAQPSAGVSPLDDEFHEVSHFSLPPIPRNPSQAAGVRGGGSLDLGQAAGITEEGAKKKSPDPTVVAPVAEELLAQSAREEITGHNLEVAKNQDMTVVATVDPKLLSQTVSEHGEADGLDEADITHFRNVYEQFLELRRQCGEQTKDIAFERFLGKLKKNRAKLIDKYNCKTVRFQVYEKDGKAALKATPVR